MEKQTLRFMIPQELAEGFRKFAAKMQRHLPTLAAKVGEPYNKVFRHCVIESDAYVGLTKAWHTVCDVELEMPEDSGWRLLATFEDGDMYVTDPSRELIFKNPAHGKNYGICDVCKHTCKKKAYVVYNEATGEELQVGAECAKKFGLESIGWVSDFTRELYETYDLRASFFDIEDDIPMWRHDSQKDAFRAIETSELICASKAYFDQHPAWIKGYWEGRTYHKSQSNNEIKGIINLREYDLDKEYAAKVCDHIKATANADTEFGAEMLSLADAFYASPADAAKGFFMVKAYEDHIKAEAGGLAKVEKGMQVKVKGRVVQAIDHEGYYGITTVYTIETDKGYTVSRRGTIPLHSRDGDYDRTEFYALVEENRNGTIIAGRATKHPKKGIETIEL